MEGSGAGNGLECSKVIELNGSAMKVENPIPPCCRKAIAALPEAEAKLHATVISGWFSGHRCSSGQFLITLIVLFEFFFYVELVITLEFPCYNDCR